MKPDMIATSPKNLVAKRSEEIAGVDRASTKAVTLVSHDCDTEVGVRVIPTSLKTSLGMTEVSI